MGKRPFVDFRKNPVFSRDEPVSGDSALPYATRGPAISKMGTVGDVLNSGGTDDAAVERRRAIHDATFPAPAVLRDLTMNIAGLDPKVNREPRSYTRPLAHEGGREVPTNCALHEWQAFGWPSATPPPDGAGRLLITATELGGGVRIVLVDKRFTLAAFERHVETIALPSGPDYEHWRVNVVWTPDDEGGDKAAAPLAYAFDSVFIPADAPRLAHKVPPGAASTRLLCSPGWVQADSFGTRLVVVAANPDLRSGSYAQWGWVNSHANQWWHAVRVGAGKMADPVGTAGDRHGGLDQTTRPRLMPIHSKNNWSSGLPRDRISMARTGKAPHRNVGNGPPNFSNTVHMIPTLDGVPFGFIPYKDTDHEYALNAVAARYGGGTEIGRAGYPGLPEKHFYPRQPKHRLVRYRASKSGTVGKPPPHRP